VNEVTTAASGAEVSVVGFASVRVWILFGCVVLFWSLLSCSFKSLAALQRVHFDVMFCDFDLGDMTVCDEQLV
jgi:hypothetical protein